jgi:hypothetical protein
MRAASNKPCSNRSRDEREDTETLANVCFDAHNGLKSDIAPCLKCAQQETSTSLF